MRFNYARLKNYFRLLSLVFTSNSLRVAFLGGQQASEPLLAESIFGVVRISSSEQDSRCVKFMHTRKA